MERWILYLRSLHRSRNENRPPLDEAPF
jgi:hypothetical protein